MPLDLPKKIISDARICVIGSQYLMQAGRNDAKLKPRLSKSSLFKMKMQVEFIRRGISIPVTYKIKVHCASEQYSGKKENKDE